MENVHNNNKASNESKTTVSTGSKIGAKKKVTPNKSHQQVKQIRNRTPLTKQTKSRQDIQRTQELEKKKAL